MQKCDERRCWRLSALSIVGRASLELQTRLAYPVIGRSSSRKRVSSSGLALSLKVRAEGGNRHFGLEFERPEIHTGKLSFHLVVHRTSDDWIQKGSDEAGPGHLLQDGEEEADPYLSGML